MKESMIFSPAPRRNAEMRLFCLPYAGGSASIFQRWPARLDPRVEMVCIEPPGRGVNWGMAPCHSLTMLTPLLCQQIIPWLDRPFAFFGHSNGALIAFELARALQRMGHIPSLFFASAKHAPSLLDGSKMWHRLPDQEFLGKLRDMGGTADAFFESQELQQLFLPTIRADFSLSETYQYAPGEKLRATPVLIAGTLDDCMDQPDRQAWSSEFTQPASMHDIVGGHFFINECPTELLAVLNTELGNRLGATMAA